MLTFVNTFSTNFSFSELFFSACWCTLAYLFYLFLIHKCQLVTSFRVDFIIFLSLVSSVKGSQTANLLLRLVSAHGGGVSGNGTSSTKRWNCSHFGAAEESGLACFLSWSWLWFHGGTRELGETMWCSRESFGTVISVNVALTCASKLSAVAHIYIF